MLQMKHKSHICIAGPRFLSVPDSSPHLGASVQNGLIISNAVGKNWSHNGYFFTNLDKLHKGKNDAVHHVLLLQQWGK